MDQEISHGRDISWRVWVTRASESIQERWIGTSRTRGGVHRQSRRQADPGQASLLIHVGYDPEALPRLLWERWRAEGWHRIRPTQALYPR